MRLQLVTTALLGLEVNTNNVSHVASRRLRKGFQNTADVDSELSYMLNHYLL